VRLWKTEEADPDKDIENAILAGSDKKQGINSDQDEEMKSATESEGKTEDEGELESNSGITFPGESIENFIGTSYKIGDDSFYSSLKVIVEVMDTDSFFFAYKKEERVFVGDCEFCYKKRVLRVLCECKRVRYCDKNCKVRDLNWHADKCTAK